MDNFQIVATILERGLYYTLVISLGAWVLALLVGIPLGMAGEHRSWLVREGQFLTASFLRSVPEILAIYILFYGLVEYGVSGAAAAIVALGLIQAGFAGEAVRASLGLVSDRQREAARSMGLNRWQVYRYVVLPQIVRPMIPAAMNILIGALKLSSIASAVAVSELMYAGRREIERSNLVIPAALALAIIYLALTLPIGRFSAYYERKIGQRQSKDLSTIQFAADR